VRFERGDELADRHAGLPTGKRPHPARPLAALRGMFGRGGCLTCRVGGQPGGWQPTGWQ
jgi:hypothetical protein